MWLRSGSGSVAQRSAVAVPKRTSCWWRSPSMWTSHSHAGWWRRDATRWRRAGLRPCVPRRRRSTDPAVNWHLIGHLQRNKIRRTLPALHWIHSVDSLRLLEALEQETAQQPRSLHVLLEVNISGDAEKTGFSTEEALGISAQLGQWSHLTIEGLMAMSALESDAEEAREDYRRLRNLRDAMRPQCPEGVTLRHLSMGMSRDFEVAIEEGATMVRVGSLLFEGVVA